MTDTLHQGLHAKPIYCSAKSFEKKLSERISNIILRSKLNDYTEKEK